MLGILGVVSSVITMLQDNRIKNLWEERKRIETETRRLAEMSIQYPDYRDLLYKLGVKQWQLENKRAAKEAWERAEYLDPNSRAVREIREFGGFGEIGRQTQN